MSVAYLKTHVKRTYNVVLEKLAQLPISSSSESFILAPLLHLMLVLLSSRVGYGFVVCYIIFFLWILFQLSSFQEFDSREAAEESVAKYHEGYFMGNKIRVELSHGGGRTAKYSGDPGACFKCGQMGHWARFVFLLLSQFGIS
jgi:hypothetical protein